MGKRKTANSLRISGLLWCHQESNRGHKDFQSFALPTELWHLLRIALQSYGFIFDCASFLRFLFSGFAVLACKWGAMRFFFGSWRKCGIFVRRLV